MTAPRLTAEVLDGLALVRGCKGVLVLTPDEVAELVKRDRVTWIRALRRGKLHKRGLATAKRAAVGVAS